MSNSTIEQIGERLNGSVGLFRGFTCYFLLCMTTAQVFARGGGGGGHGGGGGGGHGISGGHGSGHGGPLANFVFYVLLPLGLGFYALNKFIPSLLYFKTKGRLARMSTLNPSLEVKSLISIAEKLFVKAQQDWSVENLPALERILAPPLYRNWALALERQQNQGLKNIVLNLLIDKSTIVYVKESQQPTGELSSFTVCFDAYADDQFFKGEIKTSQSTVGSFREFWTYEKIEGRWWVSRIEQALGWWLYIF